MSAALVPPSIYALTPLDLGAINARVGFAFQDHVALGFCLDMLKSATLAEVWCETLDDITLIWMFADGICVEFVQVKGSEMDQLWSVAKLCEKESGTNGKSYCILEKSLAQDRCVERCRFRMVTARPVADPLNILAMPYDSPARLAATAKFVEIHDAMKPKVGTFRSQNGRDYMFWTEQTYWDVRHAEDAVRNDNLLKLSGLLATMDSTLAPDQQDELYTKLLKRVWDASNADPGVSLANKRIKRMDLQAWFTQAAAEIGLPPAGATAKLEEKMHRATLAPDVIGVAIEQMRYYRHEQLRPKYMRSDDQRYVQAEVTAVLHRLKSKLDNGKLPDNGVAFHELCLAELEKLRDELTLTPKPPLAFLQGCMYSIAGRCLHRFRRITA